MSKYGKGKGREGGEGETRGGNRQMSCVLEVYNFEHNKHLIDASQLSSCTTMPNLHSWSVNHLIVCHTLTLYCPPNSLVF